MQARRAARELAFILFSQFDKKITNYSKQDLEDIILKSVRILTSNASDELQITVGALLEMKAQIDDYEANHEKNLQRPLGVANIPVPLPMTSDMSGRISEMIDIAEKAFDNTVRHAYIGQISWVDNNLGFTAEKGIDMFLIYLSFQDRTALTIPL